MRVRFHPAAAAEVERAQAWYEERSVLAAAGFLQELTRAIQRIRVAPERYPTAEHGTRRIVLEQYPFTAFYLMRREEIFVVAVAHQKRRPGYWADRARPSE
jgi:plasmid stabilization system protein ParE